METDAGEGSEDWQDKAGADAHDKEAEGTVRGQTGEAAATAAEAAKASAEFAVGTEIAQRSRSKGGSTAAEGADAVVADRDPP